MTMEDLAIWWPPMGECKLCGHKDARHRVWDAIIGRAAVGELEHDLAADYDVPTVAIRAVLKVRPYQETKR